MNQVLAISRGAWVALALSAVLAGFARMAPVAWPLRVPADGTESAALTAELGRLRGNEDGVLTELRQQRAKLARGAWSPESLKLLQAQLEDRWHWEWRRKDQVILQRIHPRLEDWPALVSLATTLGERPGLTIESVELRAEGQARARRLSDVHLAIRFCLAENPGQKPEPALPSSTSVPTSFRPDPSGISVGISNKPNPEEISP